MAQCPWACDGGHRGRIFSDYLVERCAQPRPRFSSRYRADPSSWLSVSTRRGCCSEFFSVRDTWLLPTRPRTPVAHHGEGRGRAGEGVLAAKRRSGCWSSRKCDSGHLTLVSGCGDVSVVSRNQFSVQRMFTSISDPAIQGGTRIQNTAEIGRALQKTSTWLPHAVRDFDETLVQHVEAYLDALGMFSTSIRTSRASESATAAIGHVHGLADRRIQKSSCGDREVLASRASQTQFVTSVSFPSGLERAGTSATAGPPVAPHVGASLRFRAPFRGLSRLYFTTSISFQTTTTPDRVFAKKWVFSFTLAPVTDLDEPTIPRCQWSARSAVLFAEVKTPTEGSGRAHSFRHIRKNTQTRPCTRCTNSNTASNLQAGNVIPLRATWCRIRAHVCPAAGLQLLRHARPFVCLRQSDDPRQLQTHARWTHKH